jgi:hypothetical protein
MVIFRGEFPSVCNISRKPLRDVRSKISRIDAGVSASAGRLSLGFAGGWFEELLVTPRASTSATSRLTWSALLGNMRASFKFASNSSVERSANPDFDRPVVAGVVAGGGFVSGAGSCNAGFGAGVGSSLAMKAGRPLSVWRATG